MVRFFCDLDGLGVVSTMHNAMTEIPDTFPVYRGLGLQAFQKVGESCRMVFDRGNLFILDRQAVLGFTLERELCWW